MKKPAWNFPHCPSRLEDEVKNPGALGEGTQLNQDVKSTNNYTIHQCSCLMLFKCGYIWGKKYCWQVIKMPLIFKSKLTLLIWRADSLAYFFPFLCALFCSCESPLSFLSAAEVLLRLLFPCLRLYSARKCIWFLWILRENCRYVCIISFLLSTVALQPVLSVLYYLFFAGGGKRCFWYCLVLNSKIFEVHQRGKCWFGS